MEEEDVGNGYGSNGLGGAGTNPDKNASREEATVALLEDQPNAAGKVDCITCNVDGSSSKLVRKRHPEEVAQALA